MGAPALRIGLLGCGNVGSQVARLLTEHAADLAARSGTGLELVGVAVRDLGRDRPGIDPALLTDDAAGLVDRSDVVVELMGGLEPARTLVLQAIRAGASVVTGNKALLAQHGPELFAAADAAGVDLHFEAAVAGAVPVVRGVRESLAGDRVLRVVGVVNGTTNFVLDRMTTHGVDLAAALAEAQELGYAEADPSSDVDGADAAAKIAILASLAFHTRVSLADVTRDGIREIRPADVAAAREQGHVVKLLAIAERVGDDAVAVRVHPALLPLDHPLAAVHGPFNAVVVEAEAAGRLMFYGAGAGGQQSASAVLGDVVAAARHRVLGGKSPSESAYADLRVAGPEEVRTRYLVRLRVDDRPGVLAQIAAGVAARGVSIETVRQSVGDGGAIALLTVVTHAASEEALAATARDLAELEPVQAVLSVLRVEGT
ncbi:Homoserine dehydrogenase [Beutenbergia cavernae DSM 12333]|uniref:Homoserine dehydrogenase n=1 Tax=Beutenbergia cavernae (strain ATCC BAA-8 / DSM 12333 / CCUG 43141 / JCM 11478 / NBRC 16432 / NCIMB 13614 / HKI 0122) TaxID=471853 RepID=C5C1S3_BEUC1|nr:homoserine dehydrogenase [Beutenbergia cavernae]ACQ79541.1 Homoserine dehydrogenase [Beutenbergia cavernae DSM 12333]